jgi:hypothetical protein
MEYSAAVVLESLFIISAVAAWGYTFWRTVGRP